MNKKNIAVGLLVASFVVSTLGLVSCVSKEKEPDRFVAGLFSNSDKNRQEYLDAIVTRGAKGSNYRYNPSERRVLDEAALARISPGGNLPIKEGRMLVDNDVAFQKKLDVIDAAKKQIRMVYYIFSDDSTSSKFNRELIKKTNKDNLEVFLLVDFVTNYKNLDLFNTLSLKTKGKIKVRFYNYPSLRMFADAAYMTMPCPKDLPQSHNECRNSKMPAYNAVKNELNKPAGQRTIPASAQMLLSGIFGKNGTAIKVALGYLAEVDPKTAKQMLAGDGQSQFEKRDAIDLAVLVKEALVDKSFIAQIKLSIALAVYGSTLNPIVNELTGRFPPLDNLNSDLWAHFTDYTHHKLIMADNNEFVLGGRNIEDSYHMKQLGLNGKYVFMDTDFWAKVENGRAKSVADSFDVLFKHPMTVSLEDVNLQLPNDFIANTAKADESSHSVSEMAVGACLQEKAKVPTTDLASCFTGILPKLKAMGVPYKNLQERVEIESEKIQNTKSVALGNTPYTASDSNPEFGNLSSKDIKSASFYYIENTHPITAKKERITGSTYGFETENGKMIHDAWYRSLEQTCAISSQKQIEMKAIFHTAYFFLPAGFIYTLSKMMSGEMGDCSRVEVVFITNSQDTTDLGPINILARYQLVALFHYHNYLYSEAAKNNYKTFAPKLSYYEYLKNVDLKESLHTKTSLIGEDLFVGSANADVRSYYMDSNNALLIRNAYDLNFQYKKRIYDMINDGKKIVKRSQSWLTQDMTALYESNKAKFKEDAVRWNQASKIKPEWYDSAAGIIDQIGTTIRNDTWEILFYPGKRQVTDPTGPVTKEQLDNDLSKTMKSFDSAYKVF